MNHIRTRKRTSSKFAIVYRIHPLLFETSIYNFLLHTRTLRYRTKRRKDNIQSFNIIHTCMNNRTGFILFFLFRLRDDSTGVCNYTGNTGGRSQWLTRSHCEEGFRSIRWPSFFAPGVPKLYRDTHLKRSFTSFIKLSGWIMKISLNLFCT